jgi:hypothetical protein
MIPVDTFPLEAQLVDAMRDGLAIFDPRSRDMAARTSGDEFSVVLTAMGLPADGSGGSCFEDRRRRLLPGRHGWCRHEARDN